MAKRASKLKLFEEIQKGLGVSDEQIALIPDAVQKTFKMVQMAPMLVAFAVSPSGATSISTSGHPQTSEAYLQLADMAVKVAEELRRRAVEVAKDVGDQEEVEPNSKTSGDDEQGDGGNDGSPANRDGGSEGQSSPTG